MMQGSRIRTMTITGDPRKTLMPLDGESLRFDTPTLLVSIEPRYADGEMRINLLKLSDDEAAWLTPRLCCYASTHGANTLIIEILKVRYASLWNHRSVVTTHPATNHQQGSGSRKNFTG